MKGLPVSGCWVKTCVTWWALTPRTVAPEEFVCARVDFFALDIGAVKLPWVDWFKHGMSLLLLFPLIIIRATGSRVACCNHSEWTHWLPLIGGQRRRQCVLLHLISEVSFNPNPSVSARNFLTFRVPVWIQLLTRFRRWRRDGAALPL